MRILALDLSKRSAGWAAWGPDDGVVASGTWVLGSEFTPKGRVFARLHEEMSAINALGAIDHIFYEKPLNLGPEAGNTSADTINILVGLAMHAESWGEAMGVRLIADVHMATWRRFFLGKMPRATRTDELKQYAMSRCRQLGFKPIKHDQAEALGILDFGCEQLGITPPWRAGEVLRAPLVAA